MSARWPSKSAERDRRRIEQAIEAENQRLAAERSEREDNWQREALKSDVEALPDCTESAATLKNVLRYLLERAHD